MERGKACATCGASFPIAGGVDVFAVEPWLTLHELRDEVANGWARAAALQTLDPSFAFAKDAHEAAARRATTNQALFERLATPVLPLVRAVAKPSVLTTKLAAWRGAWSFENMLPDFSFDWNERPATARAAVVEDARQHVPAHGSSVVLGCGAGGLARDIAEATTGPTLGIDLRLPQLLLARTLANGERHTCVLEHGAPIELEGARVDRLDFAVAHAERLPFADESVDFVATEYLLDIVPDPERILREVHRVLRTGGVWASLGLPFRLANDPKNIGKRTGPSLSALAAKLGFALLKEERPSGYHLDFARIHPWGGPRRYAVHVVARKTESRAPAIDDAAFSSFFAGDPRALDALVPVLRDKAGARRSRPLVATGAPSGETIEIGHAKWSDCDEATAATLVTLLSNLDGSHTTAEVTRAVIACQPALETADVVVALMMLWLRGELDLRAG